LKQYSLKSTPPLTRSGFLFFLRLPSSYHHIFSDALPSVAFFSASSLNSCPCPTRDLFSLTYPRTPSAIALRAVKSFLSFAFTPLFFSTLSSARSWEYQSFCTRRERRAPFPPKLSKKVPLFSGGFCVVAVVHLFLRSPSGYRALDRSLLPAISL